MKRHLLSTTMSALLCVAAGPDAAEAFAKDKPQDKSGPKDVLLVNGKDFHLKVREPSGWHGDTKPDGRYQANLVIRAKNWRNIDKSFVAVRVNTKTDENIEKDLKADMEIYRKSFPGVKFDQLQIGHPYYKSSAKLFYVNGEFYEYVCYLNPGKSSPFLLSVTLTKQKEKASSKELDALSKIVESIEISNNLQRGNQTSMDFAY